MKKLLLILWVIQASLYAQDSVQINTGKLTIKPITNFPDNLPLLYNGIKNSGFEAGNLGDWINVGNEFSLKGDLVKRVEWGPRIINTGGDYWTGLNAPTAPWNNF